MPPGPGGAAVRGRLTSDDHECLVLNGQSLAQLWHNNDLRAIDQKLKRAIQSVSRAYEVVWRGMQAVIVLHVQVSAYVIAVQHNIAKHYKMYEPQLVDLVKDDHEPPLKHIWQQQVLLNAIGMIPDQLDGIKFR